MFDTNKKKTNQKYVFELMHMFDTNKKKTPNKQKQKKKPWTFQTENIKSAFI